MPGLMLEPPSSNAEHGMWSSRLEITLIATTRVHPVKLGSDDCSSSHRDYLIEEYIKLSLISERDVGSKLGV